MSKYDYYDYDVLCIDKNCFMRKSECIKKGYDYIDLLEDMLEDLDLDDDEEIEQFLYGEGWE